jgi:hypothetical protein
MNKWIQRASVLATGLVVGCATLGGGEERLNAPLPGGEDTWNSEQIYQSEVKGRYKILEIPGKGQTVNNWTELFTTESYNRTYSPDGPEAFMNKLKAKMQQRCPTAEWNVLQQDEHSILYEWSISNCPGNEDQHELARIVTARYTTWRTALTSKAKDFPTDKRDDWIKALAAAKPVAQ